MGVRDADWADDSVSKDMRWATCSLQCSIGRSCLPLRMVGEASSGEYETDFRGDEACRVVD
jgi:hypothetical protein